MPLPEYLRLQHLAMPSSLTVVLVSLLLASPFLIFWLWLVILPAKVAILCPVGCRCDPGGYEVTCYNTSLNDISFTTLTDIRVLWFNRSIILFLWRDSLVSRGLTELEILRVEKSGLRKIELGAFNGLTKLTQLSIIFNNISEIKPRTFQNLRNMERLQLAYNKLQHCDSELFSGLVKLNYVELSGNKLQYLHPDTFLELPNLQYVLLYSNPFLQIPTDRNFINSHSLSRLDISSCNVSSVSVETFANVSALERLSLSRNNLRSVDINILKALPKLSALLLYGNPLQCDCQLQEVWRWCEDRNIRTEAGYRNILIVYGETPTECDTPTEVKGMWWGVLEKGQCLEGNIQYYGDYNSTRHSYIKTALYRYGYISEFLKENQIAVYAVPFIFGTISNVILLIIITCNRDMRTVPNMYIINLAISDIINLTVLFSEACANTIFDTWLDSDFMCRFLPFSRRLSVGLSAYSVAVYSFQRYRVTLDPFQILVSSHSTWRVTVVTICGVWIVAAFFAIPSTLSKYLCTNIVNLTSITYYQHVVIFELFVSCVLPLCVVAFSYIMTARHLVESSRCVSGGTQNPQLNTRRNTAKIVVGLTVVFLISYVPYHVVWTHIIWSQKLSIIKKVDEIDLYSNHKLKYMYLISNCFLLINSCFNPVALFCTSSPFRRHLKRYLTCFCKTNSPTTDFELTRRN